MAHKALAWGANFVAVGVDTNLYTRALDKRLAMFKPVAEQAEGKGATSPPVLALASGQRLCQQGDGMFAAFAGGHLYLPFAGFTVGHHQIRAALLNLPEQRRANGLR
ncbi:2-keto-3-deoxy-L-rhamnonate aldolase [Klebsiella michiganensis]|nr:2-keto-3-deoxy-L-rhamnonate aldolase [Klebsiella michiganensis]